MRKTCAHMIVCLRMRGRVYVVCVISTSFDKKWTKPVPSHNTKRLMTDCRKMPLLVTESDERSLGTKNKS